ncbi:ABC transporter ATP-binding protein [Desulfuribacillus alkaliarsenatis]|uniref:Export ABC transporter ATP-binding protein n=1 Tax=Desulfuribacillus alkaliarsenatis TaxID=766136 RepID=A0A1E5G372_9FIRM|nr:ABC transporter ATP-binding protein [Desulfuribacillus alkaliarsenatis]OEF97526.1 export ABC transporter ATP-binding protein [Desulfuribacillus alkaliarsenatis]
MLQVKNVSKAFAGKEVVKNISFSVDQGESFGLLGPNGAGKSTTIHMIAGLLQPTSGTVSIDFHDIQNSRKQAQMRLGVVPQEIALYQDFSAEDNLKFWGRMYNLTGKELTVAVQRTLDIVGLTERRKDQVETFSGGMKRRINIACALLHEPKLLIMDEPTVGIDPQSRNHILETVKELNRQGMTVLYTSHYMEEVQYLCETVGIIDQGQLIANGYVKDIIKQFGDLAEIQIQFAFDNDELAPAEKLQAWFQPLSQGTIKISDNQMTLLHKQPELVIQRIAETLKQRDMKLLGVKVVESSLESVFLQLTGRALRD